MNMCLYIQRKIRFIGYIDKLNKLKKCYIGCMNNNKGVSKDGL